MAFYLLVKIDTNAKRKIAPRVDIANIRVLSFSLTGI